jgi:DNA-binding transcriptional ArsR family regulator
MLIPFFSNDGYNRGVKKALTLRDQKKATVASRPAAVPGTTADLAAVLQALSDPVRLHIVRRAADHELACCEFGLDLPKATLSHHFKVLREAGVIAVRNEGTRHLTSLNRELLDERFPGLIDAVLAAAASVKRER